VQDQARLFGRGQILGTFRETSELSAAFLSEGEACLALPVEDAAPAVAKLIRTIHERVDMDLWVWGYGGGPDDLVTLSDARAHLPGLDDAFTGAGEDEVIALLALLTAFGGNDPRVLSRRASALLGSHAPGSIHFPLAMRTGPTGVAHRVLTFRAHGGEDRSFWAADRTLGVRFRFDRSGATFRAHHPVIQEELEQRCAEDGIDLR